MSTNIPITSFINLFNNINYDPTTNPNPILDIWNSYEISVFYKDQLRYFQFHEVSSTDTWVSLALFYYNDTRLWWLIPLFNVIENPFIVMSKDMMTTTVRQLKILRPEYVNQLLLTARQQKIQNDRNATNGTVSVQSMNNNLNNNSSGT